MIATLILWALPVAASDVQDVPETMSAAEARHGPVPSLGGDTDAVLREAGYTDDEIAAFREQGAV